MYVQKIQFLLQISSTLKTLFILLSTLLCWVVFIRTLKNIKYAYIFVFTNTYKYAHLCWQRIYAKIHSYLERCYWGFVDILKSKFVIANVEIWHPRYRMKNKYSKKTPTLGSLKRKQNFTNWLKLSNLHSNNLSVLEGLAQK